MLRTSLYTAHLKYVKYLILMLTMLVSGLVYSQELNESEPNNTCLTAQSFGNISLPSTILGSLNSSPELADVDFFQLEVIAGQAIVVDLEGNPTQENPLSDPFLGLFDSNCNLLAINDDTNGLNSRLSFSVPENGLFVLGVTNCCDGNFEGGGIGSYSLRLNEFFTINAIEGRLVNAINGAPLSGSDFPYANIQLLSCSNDGCFDFIANQQADNEGIFSFKVDQLGSPLPAGVYQVQASALGFETLTVDPFSVDNDELFSLGDIGLAPLQYVGSIGGRVIDALNSNPLAGNSPPYAMVYLERCENVDCFAVAIAYTDDLGLFMFDGINYNLSPGNYRLLGFADGYQQNISPQISVVAFEQVDIGDFALTPLPIQFGTTLPCIIPSGGGVCEFGIEVRYRGTDNRYLGKTWGIIEFYSPQNVTRFQVGKRGIDNANPQRISLKQDQSETVIFQLNVGQSVPDGSTICGFIALGQGPEPQFNRQGEQFIFCSYKQSDGLIPLSEKEARKHLNKLKNKNLPDGLCLPKQLKPNNQFLCNSAIVK